MLGLASLPPSRAALMRSVSCALGLTLLVGCGIDKQTHRAALRDAEDTRIALAKSQSRAILAERDLKSTQASLRKAQSDLATLKREKQQLSSSPENEILEAIEEIIRDQDALAATLRKDLEAPSTANKLSIHIKSGYITITLEPSALFDAKDALTSEGKPLAKLIFESIQAQDAQALLMCHPSSDAKDNSRARCEKQLKALGALNNTLKTKSAALGVMERLAPSTPTPLLEIILLPELETLGQEIEQEPKHKNILGDIEGGVLTGGS